MNSDDKFLTIFVIGLCSLIAIITICGTVVQVYAPVEVTACECGVEE